MNPDLNARFTAADLPRLRRRNAAVATRTFRQLRTVVALCRLLEDACEEAADGLEDGGAMARYLAYPDHTVRLLRSLATQSAITADTVGGDLPAGI